jgi:hypothetical protein
MQTHPNILLMKILSLRDMKSFTMCVSLYEKELYLGGRNALQLAAECSESVELLKNLVQIDMTMVERSPDIFDVRIIPSALGFLCGCFFFCSFKEMFNILIAADSSFAVGHDSLTSCFRFYRQSDFRHHQTVLIIMELLLEANLELLTAFTSKSDEGNIFHRVSEYLEGDLAVNVLS